MQIYVLHNARKGVKKERMQSTNNKRNACKNKLQLNNIYCIVIKTNTSREGWGGGRGAVKANETSKKNDCVAGKEEIT